jgi:hypothetical protein
MNNFSLKCILPVNQFLNNLIIFKHNNPDIQMLNYVALSLSNKYAYLI